MVLGSIMCQNFTESRQKENGSSNQTKTKPLINERICPECLELSRF